MADKALSACHRLSRTADRKVMGRQTHILRFDAFELDYDNRQLRQDGMVIELGSRYFDALALLVAQQGELVTKDRFMDEVWRGVPVTDEALTQCIRTLRRALGDNAAAPRFIQTVPKHGYRFIAATSQQAVAAKRMQASLVAGAATIAGLTAGIVAGLLYGMATGTGAGQVLILAAMIGALGLLAGAGLGVGIAAALTWRIQADWWMVPGAAIGGVFVGALGNLLGREGVGLLSGVAVLNVTGPFEGVVLGAAAGVAARAALAGHSRETVIAITVIVGFAAATLIIFSGGTLLAGSLHALEQDIPGTQLSMAKIGMLIGEQGFTRTAQRLTVAVECQVFILAVTTAIFAVRDRA